MANLGYFDVDTDGDYKTIEEVTELTFTEGTQYSMQAINKGGYLTVCCSATKPTEGGFVMKDLEKFSYTPVSGVNCYLKTPSYGFKVGLNIAS